MTDESQKLSQTVALQMQTLAQDLCDPGETQARGYYTDIVLCHGGVKVTLRKGGRSLSSVIPWTHLTEGQTPWGLVVKNTAYSLEDKL